MASSETEKPAPAVARTGLQNPDRSGGLIDQTSTPNCAASQTKLLPRHHNRALARLAYYRDRVDLATSLMQHALDLREQLTFGLDLDEMRDQVDALKRAVAVYAQRAS